MVLAEIDISRKLTNEIDVHVADTIGAQRRKTGSDGRRSIGRRLIYSPSAFRSPSNPLSGRFRWAARPTSAAHRAEQDGVRGAASRKRFGGQRLARGVDRASAERELSELKLVAKFSGALFQDAHRDATISGPIPSPGRRTIFFFLVMVLSRAVAKYFSPNCRFAPSKFASAQGRIAYSPVRSSCQCGGSCGGVGFVLSCGKIRLLSSHDNTFNRDFLVEDEKGQRARKFAFSK